MRLYLRKSVKAGPFRYTLSKSGIEISGGIPGFQVNSAPRGNYIQLGDRGIYYQKSIHLKIPVEHKSKSSEILLPRVSTVIMEEIESKDVYTLSDGSSNELLDELNSKAKILRLSPISIILTIFMTFAVFIYFQNLIAAISWAILAIVMNVMMYNNDQVRKTTVIFYDLQDQNVHLYEKLCQAFEEIASCSKCWHIISKGDITSTEIKKRQAGASVLINRRTIKLAFSPPPYVSTNIKILNIPFGKQDIYLFPDRILVYDGRRFGSIHYPGLTIQNLNIKFIEEGSLPPDSRIVDTTWKYANIKGGPDRRFKYNRQYPVALYSQLNFTSPSGLNEAIQLSKPNLGEALRIAITEIANVTRPLPGLPQISKNEI